MQTQSPLTMLDFTVIGIYIAALLALGFWVSFRKQHTTDLFLAGRSLGWPNIGLSILGTNLQPSFLIGSCGIAYATGMVAANYEWLAWFFLVLLAMVFIPHYMNTRISTMPEFLSRRYSESCRNFLSWYTLFSTIVLWLGGVLYAGGLLLGQILDWPYWVSVVVLTIIATSFTVTGGLAAVVITDSFQMILMVLGSAAIVIIGLFKVGGIETLAQSVPADFWVLFRPHGDPEYPWHAFVLGYPVIGIWFWCTDQTIVQRVLGGRDIRQGQLGCVFAGFLKVLTPFLFLVPGIICAILYPNLASQDEAYMTMVRNLLPAGMVGLIVAVLIAALISSLDSGLNSFGTVFTLDIYKKMFNPDADDEKIRWVGRVTTVVAAFIAIFVAVAINMIKDMNLFNILQTIISFLAPSMAAVFLIGVLWKRATSAAAFWTLVVGTVVSITMGIDYLYHIPFGIKWPPFFHFLVISFTLFACMSVFMIVISLLTKPPAPEKALPSLKQGYEKTGHAAGPVWAWWALLAVIMLVLYLCFN